jgi:hypothetical protein
MWATMQGWLNAKAWVRQVRVLLMLGVFANSQRLFDDRRFQAGSQPGLITGD